MASLTDQQDKWHEDTGTAKLITQNMPETKFRKKMEYRRGRRKPLGDAASIRAIAGRADIGMRRHPFLYALTVCCD
jgi:hypothetical protein